jgi:hypothetical protein
LSELAHFEVAEIEISEISINNESIAEISITRINVRRMGIIDDQSLFISTHYGRGSIAKAIPQKNQNYRNDDSNLNAQFSASNDYLNELRRGS